MTSKSELHLTVGLPLTGSSSGNGGIGHVATKAAFVSAKELLPQVNVVQHFYDDKSIPSRGVVKLIESYNERSAGFIGNHNSAVTLGSAGVSSHFGMVQISGGSTNPSLADKSSYSTFFRPIPDD
eukprot:Awhi_evm1s986